jgi:hypothetical protein
MLSTLIEFLTLYLEIALVIFAFGYLTTKLDYKTIATNSKNQEELKDLEEQIEQYPLLIHLGISILWGWSLFNLIKAYLNQKARKIFLANRGK